MRRILTILTLMTLLAFTSIPIYAQTTNNVTNHKTPLKTITINIEGMSCLGCANKISNSLKSLDGVKDCKVNIDESKATVKIEDGKVTNEQLVKAVVKAGYTAQIGKIRAEGEHKSNGNGCPDKGEKIKGKPNKTAVKSCTDGKICNPETGNCKKKADKK